MTEDRSEIIQIPGFWLELKRAWDKWQQGEPMPPLSYTAQLYFENISYGCLNDALKALGRVYENVPPMRTRPEAWAHVFRYLVEARPRAALRVLDDIFLRARANANTPMGLEPLDEMTHQIGWILNQFHMRVRDVARAYAGEHGTPAQAVITGSINQPVGGTDEGVTMLDILSFMDPNWATALEREELRTLGGDVAATFFPTIRTAFKLRLYLRLLREHRDVIIPVTNKTVLALAGINHSVFSAAASQVFSALAARVAAEDEYQELDREARVYYLGYAALSLSDRTELWTHLGECMVEFLTANKAAAPKDQVPAHLIVERMEAFANLLLQELKQKDALLSENELAPLFTAIARARQQHGL